jgi:hypothetical protein
MEKENKKTSAFDRQSVIEPSVSEMETEEKETFNGQPTQAAHPATDENISGTTDITLESVGPSTATSDTNTAKAAPADDYLTGLKLAAVLAAVTMATFLMTLDLSVAVTVGYGFSFGALLTFMLFFLMRTNGLMDEFAAYPEDHYAFSLNGRYWLVWVGVSPSKVSILLFERPHTVEGNVY